MSLLMKALEKAAKDRGDARSEPAPSPASAAAPARGAGLSLEPVMEKPSAALPPPSGEPMRPLGSSAPAPEASARDSTQIQAGTVLQAQAGGRPATGGIGVYMRSHPVALFGILAGIVALAFGVYVYLQISNPALFITRPPAPAVLSTPAAPAPVPAQSMASTTPAPLPAAAVLKQEAVEAAAATPPAAERARAKPQAAPATTASPTDAQRSTISVSSGSAEPVLNPLLTRAYTALQAGRTAEAKNLYDQLAITEPRNIDALLGLAAIAVQQGETDEAVRHFLRILELEPRNALAQSGLIALLGRADPAAAESRLRQLIAREPSAYLHFTLGNLYADQSQWAAAQQSYFQAHHLEPVNPDYAYNLAVALEHVSQARLALGFYRRAVELAAARGLANFSVPQAQQRISKLATQVE